MTRRWTSLTTLLWTDGLSSLPCDCRLHEKNDHFLSMLQTAKDREFRPRYVCFDSWYSSLDNLKPFHLKGYGVVQVFRVVAANGDPEHWATSDLKMMEITRSDLARQVFATENYHCQLKPCCGVERAQVRSIKAQTCHILLSVRAFVRLEAHRLQTGISGYAAKADIIREAIRLYLRKPTILLEPTA